MATLSGHLRHFGELLRQNVARTMDFDRFPRIYWV
jgi:hypothetical protein